MNLALFYRYVAEFFDNNPLKNAVLKGHIFTGENFWIRISTEKFNIIYQAFGRSQNDFQRYSRKTTKAYFSQFGMYIVCLICISILLHKSQKRIF